MAEKIHSLEHIIQYLDRYKKIRRAIYQENQDLTVKIKPPNLSEEVSESLVCHLINDGSILTDIFGTNLYAQRFGKTGVDVLVNDKYKLECKGTTSLDGFVSVSKTNMLERDAWIWLDFQDYVKKNSKIVSVHIIHNPTDCIKPRKIEANGESKITMSAAIKDAWKAGTYRSYDFNPRKK
jgi:hypothetical protein